MASRVDLHTHTTVSDGTLDPAELFEKAAQLGVETLAVTDHDSTAGGQAIQTLADRHPTVRLIPAIEMSAEGELACHLLGYFIDPSSRELQARLEAFRRQRLERMRAMVAKLQTLGVSIALERVLALAKGDSIGRPHLADALMEKKVVKSRQEAFDRFLKKDGPAYVPSEAPTAPETIEIIRRAGGIPVLAHPSYHTPEALIQRLAGHGLMGVEAYYPEHGRALTQRYLDLAKSYGLVATGGSDFHGPRTGRPALACVEVPETVIKDLEKARYRV